MKTETPNRLIAMPVTSSDGFSLIEVIVALAVLTIGILSVNAMQIVSTRGNFTANSLTSASSWAADRVEQIFRMNYDDIVDLNGNGTNQDQNSNGIDDDDEGITRDTVLDFGLDDTTTPDGTATSNDPDQRYTIYWNVAEDVPMPNMKTIQVIVTRNEGGQTKTVMLRHMKAKYM
ncbi:MAG: type IV pilus modification PilV family protein [Desulfobulbales bacterium]